MVPQPPAASNAVDVPRSRVTQMVSTAVIHKPNQESPLGLSLKKGCVITKVDPMGLCAQSAFAGSILQQSIGKRILTVNGVPCASPTEFVEMFKAAPPGPITLQVAPASVVVASASKATEDQAVGITLIPAPNNNRIIQISKIDPNGLFANSDLQVGMNLLHINDQDLSALEGGVREAIAIIKTIPTGNPINVIAVNNNHDERIPKQQKRWSYSQHAESEASGRIIANPEPPRTTSPKPNKRFSFTNMAMNNKRNSLV